jgi:hypothetical protein
MNKQDYAIGVYFPVRSVLSLIHTPCCIFTLSGVDSGQDKISGENFS